MIEDSAEGLRGLSAKMRWVWLASACNQCDVLCAKGGESILVASQWKPVRERPEIRAVRVRGNPFPSGGSVTTGGSLLTSLIRGGFGALCMLIVPAGLAL